MTTPGPGSSNAVRAALLVEFGPCVCAPGDCVEDNTQCAPCEALDPYWDCFADTEATP